MDKKDKYAHIVFTLQGQLEEEKRNSFRQFWRGFFTGTMFIISLVVLISLLWLTSN